MEVELLSASVLDRVPGWRGRPRTAEPLAGGITNRNYRVAVDGEVFVVRIPAESGSLLGIDRRVEREASRLAAAAGVGPDVIAFVEPEGVLVTRFIEGRPVHDHAVHEPVMLERIAQSLRRIHQAGSIASVFSPFRVVEAYALMATRHGGRLPAAHERAQAVAVTIEGALSPQPPVLCHNDLLNANFIDDGVSIRIVDWEYAGMGDRFFDFGNFAVNHQLTEDDEARLLAAYFGRVASAQHARLKLMRLMSDYREAMWGVLQQAISELDFDFSAYAAKHFDRLLTGAADPRFGDWLEQATA
ncbi:MAG TPA: phosphotransferase [Candidatus Dormibacteraeota bacterium]|nr:phosphotransferase [Candidatus Dormibacteraeota bacterium]